MVEISIKGSVPKSLTPLFLLIIIIVNLIIYFIKNQMKNYEKTFEEYRWFEYF